MQTSTHTSELSPTNALRQSPASSLYHYTTASRLLLICGDGLIKPATAFISPGERPAVWLSYHPDWEPTATKMRGDGTSLSFEEMAAMDTPARIAVDPKSAPYNWGAFSRLSGCPRKIVRGLANSALESGADPRDWRVSFEPIRSAFWMGIELYTGTTWKSMSHFSSKADFAFPQSFILPEIAWRDDHGSEIPFVEGRLLTAVGKGEATTIPDAPADALCRPDIWVLEK